MKIGILTLPLRINYGGILQAYALQTVLEQMGHEVVVFDVKRKYRLPFWKYPLAYTKRIIKKYVLFKKNVRILEERYQHKTYPIRSQHTQKFIDKNIHLYELDTLKDVKKKDLDVIVVGSDQVWRPKYFRTMFKTEVANAFLKFAANWDIKRISYAASFGVDNWEYNAKQTENCSIFIKRFNAVSVREESGIKLCHEHLGINAEHVLDPTMLLTKEDYKSLLNKETEIVIDGQIMTYILDNNKEKEDFVKKIENMTGYKSFSAKSKSENSNNINDIIQPPIEHWIQGFRDAKIIITDSFHACVFSIIFRKPFLVIINENRGASRFKSLLKMFRLEDRIINLNSKISKNTIERSIPDATYDILSNMRFKSLTFLKILNNE